MSVDDWARRKAEKRFPLEWASERAETWGEPPIYNDSRESYADGLIDAFSALLSDKAVEAARIALAARGFDVWESGARIALQSAVRAVTEGDTE